MLTFEWELSHDSQSLDTLLNLFDHAVIVDWVVMYFLIVQRRGYRYLVFKPNCFFHSSYNSWWRLPTRIFFPSSASDVSHFSPHHNVAEEVATLNLLQPLLNGWFEIVVLYRNICDIKVTKHDELKWALIFRIFS